MSCLQVENALVAQTVLFADVGETCGRKVLRGRIDAVPVSLLRRREIAGELKKDSDIRISAKIVRDADFSRAVYAGPMRPRVVNEVLTYLEENQMLPGNQSKRLGKGHFKVRLPGNAFAPACGFLPTSFLSLARPYSQTFPLFFPQGRGDVDDPLRNIQVSESEWSIHMLRSVKKDLVEFPLFVFAAAFRIDRMKIVKAYHNSARYTVSADGWVTRTEGFHGRTLRGSGEYYEKTERDIHAKSEVFGYPQLFFTFSNNPAWKVTMSTALSQDGYDVWHEKDERHGLRLLEGLREPDSSAEEYHVHLAEADERLSGHSPGDLCMYHPGCRRLPMSVLLDGIDVKRLLERNGYNIQRVFEHRVRALVNNILLSPNNGLGVRWYHMVKEFTDRCVSGHAHGVAWRRHDRTEAVFKKLHDNEPVTPEEKEHVVSLANLVITATLSVDRLCDSFDQFARDRSRAETVVSFAMRHQQHWCDEKCTVENDTDGCGKHFPRLPSDRTILTSPLFENHSPLLLAECQKIKMNVRRVLSDLRALDRLENTPLVDVLQLALGEPTDLCDDDGISWSHGQFPMCQVLRTWIDEFRDAGVANVFLLSLYYAALSISTWRVDGCFVYQLLPKREVKECFTVDYNPFLLEAIEANMELSLVVYTPTNLVRYITKERYEGFNMKKAVEDLLKEGEDASLENVLKAIDEKRKLSLAEAFYRVDNSLFLTETNMPADSVDSDLPQRRGRHFIPDPNGRVFPGLSGRFKAVPELFENYSFANR